MKGTVFPILLLPKVTLEKRLKFITCWPTKFCNVPVKCLTENSYSVLLTCAMVANSEYYYFAMFSLPLWATMISRVIYFVKISTISFSFRLARHRLQSKRRSVHSSPASPLHFSRVQFIVHLVQNSASSSMQSSTTRSSPRHSFPYGRVHRHKASADSRYRYNSLMDGKACWRKGPTFHWVFSSLPLCCIRGGWEQIS